MKSSLCLEERRGLWAAGEVNCCENTYGHDRRRFVSPPLENEIVEELSPDLQFTLTL
jgi:hypothetical protein